MRTCDLVAYHPQQAAAADSLGGIGGAEIVTVDRGERQLLFLGEPRECTLEVDDADNVWVLPATAYHPSRQNGSAAHSDTIQ